MESYDVVIIGGGPGGYVAAIRAAQLKMKVAVIESDNIGGVCLNNGCIPTKSLLHSASILRHVKDATKFGIEVGDISVNQKSMVDRTRKVVNKLITGIKHLMDKNGIKVYNGFAKFVSGKIISIDGKISVTAKNIIIATGSVARKIDNNPDLWYASDAMWNEKTPKSLLIIGSGAIGMEFASFYTELGTKVTVAEIADKILINEDDEISSMAQDIFVKQGISIMTKSTVKVLKKVVDGFEVEFEQSGKKSSNRYENVLVAIGVRGNTKNLGLENTKVKVDDKSGFILTDKWLETDESGVYAIGDVAGTPCLAHKASHEGVLCAERIAGLNVQPLDKANIPSCTFSYPQIASLGLTEKVAKANGYNIRVGRFSATMNGKSIAIGETDGLIKVITDSSTGELLGIHMIGHEVTEILCSFAIAKTAELIDEDVMSTIFPHPTKSEMIHEAVLNTVGRSLHS